MNRHRIYAALITLAVAVLLVLWLAMSHLAPTEHIPGWPPVHHTEIELEAFVPVAEIPDPIYAPAGDPAAADNAVEEVNASQAAAPGGPDVKDAGPKGQVPTTVTSKQPSPVKEPKVDPEAEKRAKQQAEEEAARRKAESKVSNAFAKSEGNNNTNSSGQTTGDSGRPGASGNAAQGTGNYVTGGWAFPAYQPVHYVVNGVQRTDPSGSIVIEAEIDVNGCVTSAKCVGGKAPAASTKELVDACIAEVRARRFTRKVAGTAGEQATARVVFVFK